MIDKREILALAEQTSLNPRVIEKDYVLGWMLAGIYAVCTENLIRVDDVMESLKLAE